MNNRTKDHAYWSEQNRLWASSGLSQQKFCEQQGLLYKRFVYWRGRLKGVNTKKSEPKLLRVSTTPPRHPSPTVTEPLSYLEVILPTGIKLHIKSEADITKASALIQLLGVAR